MKSFKEYISEEFDPVPEEYPKKVTDHTITYNEIKKAWKSIRDYYSDAQDADWNLSDYFYGSDTVYKNGGEIYRIVFLDSIEEYDHELGGSHWTVDKANFDSFAHNLKGHYGDKKKYTFLITAKTPPRNISIKGVDWPHNIEEKEVQVINQKKLKILSIKKYNI